MTGSMENKLFAWEPENIPLFRLCNDLRSASIPAYFSTDTGPTMVILTDRQHVTEVAQAIRDLNMHLEVIEGKVAGPAELVAANDARLELGVA